jgi:hypothetical protein
MEILEDKALAKHIFKKYTTNPREWNFVISTNPASTDGFFDATITNPDEAWQLKIDSLYKPIPIITGTKIDIDSSEIGKTIGKDVTGSTIPFGYRKIDPPMLMNLFKKISDEQEEIAKRDLDRINQEFNSFLSSLQPTVPEKGTDYLYGPFLFTEKSIVGRNPHQKNVSEKLSLNMRRKIKERYPGYG